MPAVHATIKKAGATPSTATADNAPEAAQTTVDDGNKLIRLHITPFTPTLLKVYLPLPVQPLAKNISYHSVETFPETGFGYVELPLTEAQKMKKKLNGSTLKGSKVRIENAKPEKRKAREEADTEAAKENGEPPVKRVKKEKKKKKKKEQGVLEGAELPEDRKVKRGWTEPSTKNKKEKKVKKDKKAKPQKPSKYTKEPEMLFKTKLPPAAANEEARKAKSKDKKKDKKKSKSKEEVVVHEFEKNRKQPSFLKTSEVTTEAKPAVEYVNGQGWVDEDGNVVEAEKAKVRNRRVLELVEPVPPATEKDISAKSSPKSSPVPKSKGEKKKSKKATPPSSSSGLESDSEESSVVSSSSDDVSSESGDERETAASPPVKTSATPEISLTPSSPSTTKKEVHPLEALFKRSKPTGLTLPDSNTTSTPAKGGLAPINTSFSFFGGDNEDTMEVDGGDNATEKPPTTPFTQRDLEWRGLRSAAPTPDTAAIGRRFSFPWRNGSQEADEEEGDEDVEAGKQLSNNTKANSSKTPHLPGVAEEDEDEPAAHADNEDAQVGAAPDEKPADGGGPDAADAEGSEKPESEFRKWFWENQGNLNRSWKKRRREALKAKRLSENRRAAGGAGRRGGG